MLQRVFHMILCLVLFAGPSLAQEPEIFMGDNPWGKDPMAQAQNKEPDYLAKCFANPKDRESCFLANSSKSSGGLESYVTGELEVVTYIPCEGEGVCVDKATQSSNSTADVLSSIDITIQFDFNSAEIRNNEAPKITQLAKAMSHKLNENSKFAIIGHTDAKGTKAYNCALSAKRARTVAAKFSELGLNEARLVSLGAGEHLLKNKTNGKAAENRRVGFTRLKPTNEAMIGLMTKLCKK